MAIISTTQLTPAHRGGFQHEALLYAGEDEYVGGAVPFIREGLAAGEPVRVAVSARQIDLLRSHLGHDAGRVFWTDMGGIGQNPARIIPIWRAFAAGHAGRHVRGIGEPIWAGRTPAELTEAQRHEALLNVAFAGAEGLRILCPYDTSRLAPEVIEEAQRSHPVILRSGDAEVSHDYEEFDQNTARWQLRLPDPQGQVAEMRLDRATTELRDFVRRQAAGAGIPAESGSDLFLALVACIETLGMAARGGRLRVWRTTEALVTELGDLAHFEDPLTGREWPPVELGAGRGIWLANQLCDLVELRSSPSGAVLRLHMAT